MRIKFLMLVIFLFLIGLVSAQSLKKNRYEARSNLNKLEKLNLPFRLKKDSIYTVLIKNQDLLNKITEEESRRVLKQDILELEDDLKNIEKESISSEFNFIKNNPSSFISLDRLEFRLTRSEGVKLYDSIFILYSHLAKSVKSSSKGRQMELLFTRMNKSKVGSKAPNFEANDINSNLLSLSSFYNKEYILLDFWASWCVPCRDDFNFLKDAYSRYHGRGLEIISISQDVNILSWKKAIRDDGVEIWRHLLVPKSNKINNSILEDYFIYGIPVKVLINKQGVIIGRWRGGR